MKSNAGAQLTGGKYMYEAQFDVFVSRIAIFHERTRRVELQNKQGTSDEKKWWQNAKRDM